jgi:hypothetical protein
MNEKIHEGSGLYRREMLLGGTSLVAASGLVRTAQAQSTQQQSAPAGLGEPNIVVIFGDKDEFLPTNHGFDEFYGNL